MAPPCRLCWPIRRCACRRCSPSFPSRKRASVCCAQAPEYMQWRHGGRRPRRHAVPGSAAVAPWFFARTSMPLLTYWTGGRFIASHISIPNGLFDPVRTFSEHRQAVRCRTGCTSTMSSSSSSTAGTGEVVVVAWIPLRRAGGCVWYTRTRDRPSCCAPATVSSSHQRFATAVRAAPAAPRLTPAVLEASEGLDVIEFGCPALHETVADATLELPNAPAQARPWPCPHRHTRRRDESTAGSGSCGMWVLRRCGLRVARATSVS